MTNKEKSKKGGGCLKTGLKIVEILLVLVTMCSNGDSKTSNDSISDSAASTVFC